MDQASLWGAMNYSSLFSLSVSLYLSFSLTDLSLTWRSRGREKYMIVLVMTLSLQGLCNDTILFVCLCVHVGEWVGGCMHMLKACPHQCCESYNYPSGWATGNTEYEQVIKFYYLAECLLLFLSPSPSFSLFISFFFPEAILMSLYSLTILH